MGTTLKKERNRKSVDRQARFSDTSITMVKQAALEKDTTVLMPLQTFKMKFLLSSLKTLKRNLANFQIKINVKEREKKRKTLKMTKTCRERVSFP